MKKITIIILLSIAILIAIITRFYMLGKAPSGLYLDEAGQGYSAYSILKTGKDEFGKSFPIVFRSFTDFKTPVYIYLIVPLIPIFGLNAFTVRFPSFLFSIFTIPILYLLVLKLSKNQKLAIITSFLLAISPWHILFGRTNFECNVALFFFLTGVLSFYYALEKPKLLILSGLLFAIAVPSYHAQRIITPLMVIILFLRYKNILLNKSHFKYLIVAAIIGLIISLPTLSVATTPGFLARAGLNIFSYQKPAGYLDNYQGISSLIINNRMFLSIKEFASLYVSYFSPRNLFVLGDSGPRSSFPELGTFFLWQFPFYIYGLYKLIRSKNIGEIKFFTLSFLLIAPIPAALTRDPYSTIRSLQMVIPITISVAIAIVELANRLQKNNHKIVFSLISILLVVYSLGKLYSSVIILNEYYRGKYWNYGWEEASQIIKSWGANAPVIVDNSRDEPYIQLAFFMSADPATFQKENFEVTPTEYYINMQRNKEKHIGRLVTRPIDWEHDLADEQYMIGDELAISLQQIKEHHLTLIKEIKYPSGEVALRIVKTNPKLNH